MWQQILFILRLFVYSTIASAVIKYAAPTWGLLVNNLTVDVWMRSRYMPLLYPLVYLPLCYGLNVNLKLVKLEAAQSAASHLTSFEKLFVITKQLRPSGKVS